MELKTFTALGTNRELLPGATITAKVSGTGTAKPMYTDAGGTVPFSPAQTDANGMATFACSDGLVDVTFTMPDGRTKTLTTSFSDASTLPATFASSIGAALIGFISDLAGAVIRTIADRLKTQIWLDDFGTLVYGSAATDAEAQANAAVLLIALEACRQANNANRAGVCLRVPEKALRIKYATTSANTNPFDLATLGAKSFYQFSWSNSDSAKWLTNDQGAVGTYAKLGRFKIKCGGQAQWIINGGANSWFLTEDTAGAYHGFDIEGLTIRQEANGVANHGLMFYKLVKFRHSDLQALDFQNGVGHWYYRSERGTVIGARREGCQRALVLGDPASANWINSTVNEIDFLDDTIFNCGLNLVKSDMDNKGYVEIWQSESVRFLGTSWKSNACSALIVGADKVLIDSPYFEYNGYGPQGALTGVSAFTGGSGYTDGEPGYVKRSDGINAACACTIHATAGVPTGITITGTYPGSNFGFANGGGCYLLGSSSGASNCTVTAAATVTEAWGLTADVILNPTLSPVTSGVGTSDLVKALTIRGFRMYDGLLVRASATRKITGLNLPNCNLYNEQGGTASSGFLFKYVEGEQSYIDLISIPDSWSKAGSTAAGYPEQISVDGSTYAAVASYTGRKLPIIGHRQDGRRFGLMSTLKSCRVRAAMTADAVDQTGDGTAYQVIFNSAAIDDNGDLTTATGRFTAPVTGVYRVTAKVLLSGLLSTHTSGDVALYKNGAYSELLWRDNPYASMSVATSQVLAEGATLIALNAGDYLTTVVTVTGGTKVVDVKSSSLMMCELT